MDPHYIRDEDDDAVLKVVAPNFDENNGVLKSRDFKVSLRNILKYFFLLYIMEFSHILTAHFYERL